MRCVVISSGGITLPVVARPNVRLLGGEILSTMASNRIRFGTIRTLGVGCPRSTTYAIVVSLAMRTRTFNTRVRFDRGRMPGIVKHLIDGCRRIIKLGVPALSVTHVPRCLRTGHLTTGKLSGPIFKNYVKPCSLTNHLFSVARVVVTVCARPRATLLLLSGYAQFVARCYHTVGSYNSTKIVVTRPTTKLLSGRSYVRCSSMFIGQVIRRIRSDRFTIVLRGYNGVKRYARTVITAKTGKCRFKGGVSVLTTLRRYPSGTLIVNGLSPIKVFGRTATRRICQRACALLRGAATCPGFIVSTNYSMPPRVPLSGVHTFCRTMGSCGRGRWWVGQYVVGGLVFLSLVTVYFYIHLCTRAGFGCGGTSLPMRMEMRSLLDEVALRRGVTRVHRVRTCSVVRGKGLGRRGLRGVVNKRGCKFVRNVALPKGRYLALVGRMRGCVHRGAQLNVPMFALARSLRNSMRSKSAVFPRTVTLKDAFGPVLTCRVASTVTGRLSTRNVARSLAPIVSIYHSLH